MVVRVPRQTRLDLVRTVFAAVRQDVDGILAGFQSLGIIEPNADMAPLRTLASRLLALAAVRSTVPERIETLLADEVLAELYDAPVSLPSDMVYFARTAALIEGLGTRYDPYFNALEFATPIALKMHGRIMASLRDGASPDAPPDDWATGLGTLLGQVAGVVTRAGREIAALLGARVLGLPPQLGRRIDAPRLGPPMHAE
jgi:predicted unusual protein kinase regulating ubiquinone biosynthesis (AarF/ABC1/UbiB family)